MSPVINGMKYKWDIKQIQSGAEINGIVLNNLNAYAPVHHHPTCKLLPLLPHPTPLPEKKCMCCKDHDY